MARTRDRSVVDRVAPQLVQSSPSDDATAVPVGANIVLTFSEAVKAGAGTITVYATTPTGSHYDTIQVTDASIVTFSSNTVTINLGYDLDPETNYYVLVSTGAIKDLAGNNYAGIISPTALNFTTAGEPPSNEITAEAVAIINNPGTIDLGPWLESFTPADETTGVATGTNFVLTFAEDVKAGSGSLEIRNSSDGTLFKSIAISDTSQVQISGDTVTVNPNVDLLPGTGYYLVVQPDAVEDLSGNPFEGFGSPGYNFVTQSVPGVTLMGNSRLNTLTGGIGDDTISGLGSRDILTGGGGFDTFVYKAAPESTGSGYDTINDFQVLLDHIDLWFEVTGINREITMGPLSRQFDSDLAAAANASHLGAHHAVLVSTSTDQTFLVVDANGEAGYQSGADLVIMLGIKSTDIDSLTTYNFV